MKTPPGSTCLSGHVEAVARHDLVPRRNKIVDETAVAVVRGVDLGDGPQSRVRAEDQVVTRGIEAGLTAFPGDQTETMALLVRLPPFEVHASKNGEIVIRQRVDLIGEDAMIRFVSICAKEAQSTGQGHPVGCGKAQQGCAV